MSYSQKCINYHVQKSLDRLTVSVDRRGKFYDKLVVGGWNEDSEEVAEAHWSDQEGLIDRIFNHFGFVGKDPVINLSQVTENDVFVALNNDGLVDVSLRASVYISKGLGGAIDNEVEQVAFFLDRCIGHVRSELLDFLQDIGLEVGEVPADDSQ